MTKKLLLALTAFLPASLMAQTFTDDFESYTVGQYIGTVSPQWTTWSGATGGTEDTQVSSTNPHGGANSIYFASTAANGGPQDCVLPFGGVNTKGTFNYKMWMFVNANKGAYFNLQAVNPIGTTWALDVTFDNTGTVELTSSGSLMLSTNYTLGAWFQIELDVDLNTNTWEFFIDGVSQGIFQNGVNSIASIDLFPLQNHQFFVDDVEYTYTAYTPTTLDASAYGINNMSGLATQQVIPDLIVRNLGTTALTSFDLMLDYNGNQVTENVTGVNVAANGTYTVTLTNPIALAAGNLPVTLTVSNVNGGTDDFAGDDSKTIYINPVVPAAGKMVVGEEGTGTWCGWCPRGAVYMEQMEMKYGGFFAPIAVHNADPMTVTDYDAGIGGLIAGYPSALVDRGPEVDPSAMEPDFLSRVVTAPVVMIENGAQYNSSTRELQVSITSTFPAGASGAYKVACVLTENNVTGTTSAYAQTNYYSSTSQNLPLVGAGHNWQTEPNPVPAASMEYDYVARVISPGFGGLTNSFPGTITSGQFFTHNFTYTLPASWDENEIHIVGMVFTPTGIIDNADYTTIPEAVANGFDIGTNVGVSEIPSAPDATVKIYPNPASEITNVMIELKEETEVIIEIYSIDGKLVASKNYGKFNGSYIFPIDMSQWENGMYTTKIITGNSVTTQQIIKQ